MKNILLSIYAVLTFSLCSNLFGQTGYETYTFNGTIGSNAIVFKFYELEQNYNWYQGVYYYVKYKKEIKFNGQEFTEADMDEPQKLTESVNGKKTGYFKFSKIDVASKKIIGKWYSMDGKKVFDVVLSKS